MLALIFKYITLVIGLGQGGLAVNSFIGQPQKVFFVTKMAFPARPGATYFEFLIVYVASPHMGCQQQIRRFQVWARACYVLMVAIVGAFDKHVRILVADFLKEIPMPLFHPWNELKILCS